MPTIDISDEALSLVRGLARNVRETDSEVLDRIVRAAAADREAALKAYEQAERDVTSTN